MVSLLEVYRMADRFTLGVEEEFQLVKLDSGDLCSCVQSRLDKGAPYFEEKIKPEMLQSTVEYISDVLPDLSAARKELYSARLLLSRLVKEEGMALALIRARTGSIRSAPNTSATKSWKKSTRILDARF